jgi:hypothetical protein
MNDELAVTLIVTRALEALGVTYIVGGSLASTAYGKIRTTMDADLLAELLPKHVEPLLVRLGDAFYADETMIRNAIAHRNSFNLIHLETFFKIDIFILRARPFDRQQLERGIRHVLVEPDGIATLATPEDTILAKLDWYRLGGESSERQWRDVLGVLAIQAGTLDETYLDRWSAELGILDLLNRARQATQRDR